MHTLANQLRRNNLKKGVNLYRIHPQTVDKLDKNRACLQSFYFGLRWKGGCWFPFQALRLFSSPLARKCNECKEKDEKRAEEARLKYEAELAEALKYGKFCRGGFCVEGIYNDFDRIRPFSAFRKDNRFQGWLRWLVYRLWKRQKRVLWTYLFRRHS